MFKAIVDGITIEFRGLTEEEAIVVQDKKRKAIEDKSVAAEDDGDEEIEKLITSPDKSIVNKLLRKHPRLLEQLFAKLVSLQDTAAVEEDESVDEDAELQEKYKGNVIGIFWPTTKEEKIKKEVENEDGTVEMKTVSIKTPIKERFLFRRFSRFDTKIIDREIADNKGFLSTDMLVKRVRKYTLEPERTEAFAAERPFFYINIAWFLYSLTYANFEFEVKKALPSTKRVKKI